MDLMTLATVPAILATVNLLKSFGLHGKWCLAAATILGMVFQLFDMVTAYYSPDWRFVVYQLGQGFLLGLGAAGLYDITPNSTLAGVRPKEAGEAGNLASVFTGREGKHEVES